MSNLVLIQPPPPIDRQTGVVELKAPGDEGRIWGKVTIVFYNTDQPIKNSDMVYALEGAKNCVMKDGFFYDRGGKNERLDGQRTEESSPDAPEVD